MLARAATVASANEWPAERQRATVTLDYDGRYRRRIRLVTDEGDPFLLDLPQAVRLGEGDGLALEDGGYVRVVAAAEPVADLSCRELSETARIAWHIGNRHIPIQVLPDGALRIRDDHVIVEMARQLGAQVHRHQAPFSPEPGAYASRGGEHHSHTHTHEH